jgi:predicted enzyme related to lactoylglutathione lyase
MSTSTSTSTNPDLPSTDRPAAVTWFEIHTADPERAEQFYGSVFGWAFDHSMPDYAMVLLGDDAPHGGGIVPTGGERPNHALFNIQVPDVASACDAVVAAGGSVVMPTASMDNGLSFAYIADPDGSVVGLWCPPAA